MGVPARVREVYEAKESLLEALELVVRESLRRWCDHKDYLFKGRRKSVDSLSEKLESGRYTKWSEIDDLYACTVVVPTATHEPKVLEFLRNAFVEKETRARFTTKKPPDVFRFDTTRFVGSLRDLPGLEREPGVGDLLFEVQIPTVFEYAWSVASHDLVYKGGTVDWRRIRLAAQLKAAVEQIDMLIDNFERSADSVPESEHDETAVRAEIVNVCREMLGDGRLPQSLEPVSWTRLSTNVLALVRSYSGSFKSVAAARDLLAKFKERVEDKKQPVPLSGSLFQLFVGVANASPDASIDKFTLIESAELIQFHGVKEIARPFLFD